MPTKHYIDSHSFKKHLYVNFTFTAGQVLYSDLKSLDNYFIEELEILKNLRNQIYESMSEKEKRKSGTP